MPRVDLKKCPFCDGEAKHCRTANAYHVYCSVCGADTMVSTLGAMTSCQVFKLKLAAFSKWNTRTPPKTDTPDV
ncbi:restriction alleviation protein [Vibrio phage 1.103.O._10N.261.52.F2]|nr:restriction alleviation protein [Vibrio phage 1.103.O._10N.261.52.F2]